MNIFSAASMIAFVIYLYTGIYGFRIDKRSRINLLFMLFCIAMTIWSFAYSFVYVTYHDPYIQNIWMKISAIGWCTFTSFVLHLSLLFTERKIIKHVLVKILLYIPSGIFFYISVFLFRPGVLPSKFIQDFFYIGNFIYNFSFLLGSIFLIGIWGWNASSFRRRKQAKILVITSLLPFTLNFITQNVLPSRGITLLPNIGHIYSLILVMGIYYAMIKYKLFDIMPKHLVDEILQEMMDLVIIISPEGKIIRINNSTENLLNFTRGELINRPLTDIMDGSVAEKIINIQKSQKIFRLSDINCYKKGGEMVPLNISCSTIVDSVIQDILGIVIVGHDISMVKELEQEISEHKRAQEHIFFMANHDSLTGLPNRKYFFQRIHQSLEKYSKTEKIFAVFFLDLDGLKYINDTFGHEAGDKLIFEVGQRAKSCISGEDLVARIGGDEFTFLSFDVNTAEDVRRMEEEILETINRPMDICGNSINVSSSIGASIFPYDGDHAAILIKKADDRMYLRKKAKKAL